MHKYLFIILLLTIQIGFSNKIKNPIDPYPNFQQYSFKNFDFEDCDACGCSANGGSMGFSSMIDQNFVGLRYMYQSYQSRDGVFNNSPWVDENFNTLQAWGRVPLTDRVEVMALVPYHFNNRENMVGTQNIDGLGDITVMGFYTLLKPKMDTLPTQHKVQVGVGIKAPTGRYDSENNGSVNPSFQLGTGSWDYTVAGEYIVKRKNLGFNAMANYILKTENDKNYKFGNQFNYGGTVFYSLGSEKFTVVPQAGLAGELYAANEDFNEDVPLTEGDIFFGKVGVEMGINRFSLGLNAMLPITQNLTGGRVEANYRIGINLNYGL
ncbi:transporter [Aequorivita echinoideorum]|uniref:Transporter n=2 Tax=Aequorivita echinoideorum TaxID=1549647 RepID=A0ABS5S564_9FLAO|nr:transporter [Aequorivita echinoideorum]